MKEEPPRATDIITPIGQVKIPVPHFRAFDQVTGEDVLFHVFRHNDWFRAAPKASSEEYGLTGLPAELVFRYTNYVLLTANNLDEETLNVIKKIILELQVQDLL